MKRLSTFGSLLVSVGVIIILVSIHRVGYDLRNFSTVTEYMEKEYTFDSDIRILEITDRNSEITFSPSYDGKIHILLYENETDTYIHNQFNHTSGTKLTFENTVCKKWYKRIFDWNNEKKYFTVLIPDTSSVHISVNGKSVPLSIKDVPCASLTISTDSQVDIDTLICAEQLRVSSLEAPITLTDITCGNVTVNTTNSPISASKVMSGGKMMLVTTNASISINRIGATDGITVKTINGRISGSISGNNTDFDIRTNAVKSNIPERASYGNIPLVLEAINDIINVSFIK